MIDDDGNQEPCPAQCAEHEATDGGNTPEYHPQFMFNLVGIFVGKEGRTRPDCDGDN